MLQRYISLNKKYKLKRSMMHLENRNKRKMYIYFDYEYFSFKNNKWQGTNCVRMSQYIIHIVAFAYASSMMQSIQPLLDYDDVRVGVPYWSRWETWSTMACTEKTHCGRRRCPACDTIRFRCMYRKLLKDLISAGWTTCTLEARRLTNGTIERLACMIPLDEDRIGVAF